MSALFLPFPPPFLFITFWHGRIFHIVVLMINLMSKFKTSITPKSHAMDLEATFRQNSDRKSLKSKQSCSSNGFRLIYIQTKSYSRHFFLKKHLHRESSPSSVEFLNGWQIHRWLERSLVTLKDPVGMDRKTFVDFTQSIMSLELCLGAIC